MLFRKSRTLVNYISRYEIHEYLEIRTKWPVNRLGCNLMMKDAKTSPKAIFNCYMRE